MARKCRNIFLCRSTNLFIFSSGIVFCLCVQYLLGHSGNGLVRQTSQFEKSVNADETVLLETVIQRVRQNKSQIRAEIRQTIEDAERLFQSRISKRRLVIVVMSTPVHFKTRKIIRQTWALQKPNNTLVYFAIGIESASDTMMRVINEENRRYGDLMLLGKFKESYNSLTQKLVATLKWTDENLQADYFMKVDEDSFVRIGAVINALDSKPKESVYWGFFTGGSPIQTKGKWAERNYFLCDYYLPYAVGGGYIISGDLVHYIAENAEKLQMFNNEDVSLGTWLGPLKVSRIHDPNFNTESISRGCFSSYLVSHPHTIYELIGLNRSLYVNGRFCSEEWRYRNSYEYDWNVPPYYCCDRSDSSVP